MAYMTSERKRQEKLERGYRKTVEYNKRVISEIKDGPISTKDRLKDNHFQKNYNISLDDYKKMFKDQQGKCEICQRPESSLNHNLYVDHNHKTGKVRGLLCNKCNSAVGTVETSDFNKIQAYIAKYQ